MTTNHPEPLPPTVSDILADCSCARARYTATHPSSYRRSRVPPRLLSRLLGGSYPDTPSASFYRLYEFFILDWNVQFRNELEYFCCAHPGWAVSSLPDPAYADDADPVRLAVLAVLTQLMCAAFNRRIATGLPRDAPAIVLDFSELEARPKVFEETPDWAKRVRPLDEKIYIPNKDGQMLKENDEDVSEEFKAMNIIVQMPHIHFI
ncbi:uncharacterized protein EI90DRAFT_3048094 [Cantharellus anzutake]|uniref:uncharacterized protein n=1 Tax=Cantharellus anzutake TaxID=1750568 RepID=UPI001905775A|nr:uncharacterized protein EI90DRAFT_3048094 [Cantharellus anzutake]KAF8335374.1 hypothetical protein EI90DRAFT_3048094 [Cantharellus anzutake]